MRSPIAKISIPISSVLQSLNVVFKLAAGIIGQVFIKSGIRVGSVVDGVLMIFCNLDWSETTSATSELSMRDADRRLTGLISR